MSGSSKEAAKAFALEQAVIYGQSHDLSSSAVVQVAEQFLSWLLPPVVPTQVSIMFDSPTEPKEVVTMATMTDGQQIVAHISEKDSKGNDASVPGTWSVDRTDLVGMVVSEDGLSATLTALGPLGSAVVSLTVGALPTATATIDIVAGDVASVAMTFDAPTAIATATPAQ